MAEIESFFLQQGHLTNVGGIMELEYQFGDHHSNNSGNSSGCCVSFLWLLWQITTRLKV